MVFIIQKLKLQDLKIETYVPDNVSIDSLECRLYGVRVTHIPTGIAAECHSHKSQIYNKNECIKEILSKLPNIERTCFNCRFYDGCCCMYDYACLAILNEDDSAYNCNHFIQGIYNEDELERTYFK